MANAYLNWKGWYAADFGNFSPEDSGYYAKELVTSGIGTVHGLRIGELGFGNGTFAGWVRQQGGYWIGRELIPDLHQRAVDAGFEVIESNAGFSQVCGVEKLDLLVAFDVLEHMDLASIRTFLVDGRAVLRTGGLLIIRVPSGDSPFSNAIFRGDLTHHTLLGSGAVRQLAVEVQLEVSQIRQPVLPIMGLGVIRALRRIATKAMRLLVFPFISRVLMGNSSSVVAPNMIVVLRKGAAGS